MRALPLVVCSLAGVVLLAAAASADPSTCGGVPLPGSPEEIAATPRGDVDLELLALAMSGGLTAEASVYDRVITDVGQIFALMPEIADVPFQTGRHDGRGLLFQADDPTWEAIRSGTYTAWDCLNDYFGLESMQLFSLIHGGSLKLKGIYDTDSLVPLYEQLPGITNAGANYFGGDGPTLCGVIDSSGTHHYFFDDRRGDCPAGCGTYDIRYLTSSPGDAVPRLRGQWRLDDEEPLPDWYELYEDCVKSSGQLPATVDVDPLAPATGDLVSLTVSGDDGNSACGPFFDRVDFDDATGTFRVLADFNAACGACTADVTPYSFDVDLGALAAGDYQVRVVRRDGCSGEETLLALTQVTVRGAQEPAAQCAGGNRPAATLLVPYFEVDLANAQGPTTILSVANSGAEPVVAHVILWTDGGLPSLDFDLWLGADGLQTIDLRSVLGQGKLPLTAPAGGATPPGCASPIALPDLDGEALAVLRAKHTGLPSPADGLCYGSATDLAVGYVTVDAMNGCSKAILLPGEVGYFEAGGTGLASNRNVLWGDVFYVDSDDDAAQGVEAVAIRADAALFTEVPASSFYASFVAGDGRDNRLPLGRRYRSRFLNGGGADMTSEVIVWTEGFGAAASPRDCIGTAGGPSPLELLLFATFRDQKGGFAGVAAQHLDAQAVKLPVGAPPLVPQTSFGQIDVGVGIDCVVCGAPELVSPTLQTWMIAVSRASGRFSSAQHATLLQCGPEIQPLVP